MVADTNLGLLYLFSYVKIMPTECSKNLFLIAELQFILCKVNEKTNYNVINSVEFMEILCY